MTRDPEGPAPALAALLGTSGPCALLESAGPAGPLARLSLLAREPRAVLVADTAGVRLLQGGRVRRLDASPAAALRLLLGETRPGRWPEEGGLVGAVAYDLTHAGRERAPTPQLLALAVDRFEVFPHAGGDAAPADAPGAPASGPGAARSGAGGPRLDLPSLSSLTRARHRELVLEIKAHIAAGDIYQANLSQRFRLPWPPGGLALYRQLRRLNPAPFAGYLRAEGVEIVSASPERLLLVDGGLAATRPIAGTRPRAADPDADRALAAELLLSEKERAEHLMLVDLERNDLGRVAEIGSVEVDELMSVEEYTHVRHIVSNVRARLAPGRDAFDALFALSPGGTITGVPKLRCMQILDALEPVPRGFYTGSLFYATPSGRLDANILIRSAVVHQGWLSFHAGGGIVADSDPDFEYEETLHKAEGMRRAVEAVLARGV